MKASLKLNYSVLALCLLLAFSFALIPSGAIAGEKKAVKPFLGIVTSNIDEETREALDYKGKTGILITEVVEGTGAEKAGLKHGDILIEMEGKEITEVGQPGKIISEMKPGDKIKFVVIRDGKKEKMKAKLGERPVRERKILKVKKSCEKCENPEMGGYLGITGHTLNEKLSKFFGVKSGVMVETVGEDSPAEKSGLIVGDILYKINDKAIESFEGAYEVIRDFDPKAEINLFINRKGESKTLKCTLGEAERSHHCSNMDFDFDFEGLEGLHGMQVFKHLEHLEGLEGLEDLEIIIKKGLEDCDFDDICKDFKHECGEYRKDMDEMKKEMKKMKEEMEKMKK